MMYKSRTKGNLNAAVEKLIRTKGYVAPVDVMLEMEIISQKDYAEWRRGKVAFLEKVSQMELGKLSGVMKELKNIAFNKALKPSKSVYEKWGSDGKSSRDKLRFSKTGAKNIEDAYSTHYIARKPKKGAPNKEAEAPVKENKFEKRMREKREAELKSNK